MPVRLGRRERRLERRGIGGQGQVPPAPGQHVAALRRRAADQRAPAVHPVAPEPPGRGRVRARRLGQDDAQRGGRSDVERDAARVPAVGAHVRARAVAARGMPGHARERGPARGVRRDQAGRGGVVDGRELRGGDSRRGQHLGVPAARDLIEQAGAGGHREARGEAAGEPRVQVLAEAAPDRGAREDLGAALAQPAELGGEERGVQRRAGARVNAALVVIAAERGGRGRAAGVGPGDDRRERAAGVVEREQAVPEDGGAHRRDLGRARAAAAEARVDRARSPRRARASASSSTPPSGVVRGS